MSNQISSWLRIVAVAALITLAASAPASATGIGACGDGAVQSGEECDPGGALHINGDPALPTCTTGGDCFYVQSCCNFNCQYVGQGATCNDGDACTGPDVCNQVGTCIGTGNSPNGTSCNDGLFCNGSETCTNGVCGSSSGNPCPGTDCNTCGEATDTCFTPQGTACDGGSGCITGQCNGSGSCVGTFNTNSCNDGLFCNGSDTCSGGSCSLHAGNPCTTGPECANACNETADNCIAAAGATCGDDGNPCTTNACNGSGTCAATNNTLPCNDGSYCNGTDTCAAGSCSEHTGDPCAGGPECLNVCDAEVRACRVSVGTPCTDDGNVCTTNTCDIKGTCIATDNMLPCDDALFCDGADTCAGGFCSQHAGDPCAGGPECANVCDDSADTCYLPAGTTCTDDENNCTTNECDGSGTCAANANTLPCTDGIFCNGADTCSDGACSQHAGDPCPDNVSCTVNACDEDAGTCNSTPEDSLCDDGLFCNGSETCDLASGCQAGTSPCNDGNSCTLDNCAEDSASCSYDTLPELAACDDGTKCTVNDQCTGGICVGHDPLMVDLCPWTVVVSEDPRGDRIKSFLQSRVDGKVCASQLILGASSFNEGDVVAMKNSGRVAIRVGLAAEITGNIVSGGGGAKGKPTGVKLPYTADVAAFSGGTVIAKTDASGDYDLSGSHPLVAACGDARQSYSTVASALAAMPSDFNVGRIRLRAGESTTVVAPNPGGMNVIDADEVRGAGDVVLTLDGGGNPATTILLRVAGRLQMRTNASIELTGGLTPDRLLIDVTGRKCDLGNHSQGAGTLFCPAARIKIGYDTVWTGAWFASQRLARIGERVALTYEPFQAF